MIKPILHDLKRTLTSLGVLIIIALTIVIAAGGAYGAAQISQFGFTSGVSSSTSVAYYYNSTGFHLVMFSADQYGNPLSGTTMQVNLTQTANLLTCMSKSGSQLYVGTGTTDSNGLTFVNVDAPAANYSYSIKVIQSSFTGESSSCPLEASGGGYATTIYGSAFSTVIGKTNASQVSLLVFHVGPNGTAPNNYLVGFKVVNVSEVKGGPFPSFNYSQMTPLGTMHNYYEVFTPSIPSNASVSNSITWVGLFYPNQTVIEEEPVNLLPFTTLPINSASLVLLFFTQIFAFFIPLIAIIGAYVSYGRDRITGVLESILSKPVSRFGLSLTRYLATFTGLGIGIVAGSLSVDAVVHWVTGSFLASNILLASLASFLVELAAFIGIMFVLSRVFKSTGALIAIGLVLFIILDFAWSFIVILVTLAAGVSPLSGVYAQTSATLDFFDPLHFISLVSSYLQNAYPASYNINVFTLALAGVVWIAWPLGLFLYLAIKRD